MQGHPPVAGVAGIDGGGTSRQNRRHDCHLYPCRRPFLTPAAFAGELFVYAGSYTGGGSSSKGITLLKLDTESGALTSIGDRGGVGQPVISGPQPGRHPALCGE